MSSHFPERTAKGLCARHQKLANEGDNSVFTADQRAQLQHLRNEERHTWVEVAMRMPNRTPQQLSSYYCRKTPLKDRVNVEPRYHHSKETLDRALRLRQEGVPLSDIARRLSIVSTRAIRSLLSTAQSGVLRQILSAREPCTRRYTAEEDLALVQLKAVTSAWDDIVLHFQERSASSLRNRFQRLKEQGDIVKGFDGTWKFLDNA
ncbi:hypothetical protein LTR78_002627 [Recurvomyces mirabilis]|uniref:Myb-like domain-containing protein n=1 Tax=Recurvomyces mirabilis TaxID=574656 RepID=A0AAE0WTT2_9PEZI|nr:hypothetical protein LTR78_002627 [Recurvomyces mirabilis]KAK5157556.1 hypothetical protein LTS14_004321 [Recurvomyces mirabilis]